MPHFLMKLPAFLRSFRLPSRQHLLVVGSIGLSLGFIGILVFLKFGNNASANWYNDSYTYRQSFTFTHNAAITTPRAVTFSLDTAELIDGGFMQADCDDIFFTDLSGNKLTYNMTGSCNNAATTYEVVFPSIVNGSNAAYVYYGNSTASSGSRSVAGITALTPSGGDPALTDVTGQQIAPGPLVVWMFNDGTGTTANDATSNNNDGTLVNGPVWKNENDCVNGKCLEFDGSDDYVNSSFDFYSDAFTACTWVNPAQLDINNRTILTKSNASGVTSGSLEWRLTATTSSINYVANNSSGTAILTIAASTALPINTWSHVCVVQSGSGNTGSILLNTNVVGSATQTGTMRNTTNPVQAAVRNTSNNSTYWKGKLDDVRIYPAVRSLDQIKTDYVARGSVHGVGVQVGNNRPLPNKIVQYTMNEGVGTTVSNSIADYATITGTLGTGSSAPSWVTDGKFGNALLFDGTDDVVTTAHNANISPVSNFAFSTWFRPAETFYAASTANQTIFDNGDHKFYLDETDGKGKWAVNYKDALGALGSGVNAIVYAMVELNGELYIAGQFTDAGGDPDADRIAKWDGSSWSWPTGMGLNNEVYTMTVWNNEIYVGGQFTNAGGDADADSIAKWDGSSWSWPTGQALDGMVFTLEVWNNELYAGGNFNNAGSDPDADSIAKWDGSSWSWPTGQSINDSYTVHQLFASDHGLYVGADFLNAGGDPDADYIALWNGTSFSWPTGQGLNNHVLAFGMWNNELYVGGHFTDAGGDGDADYIAKWDGASWSWPTGMGLNVGVQEIAVATDGIYAVGSFTDAGGDPDADRIAKWDGSAWSWPDGLGLNNIAWSIFNWNDTIYIGGSFSAAGGNSNANRITYLQKPHTPVISTATSWTNNTWYHAAGIHDGTYLRLYINGIEQEQIDAPKLISQNLDLRLGNSHTGEAFKGTIDEFHFYNSPLSIAQIAEDMENINTLIGSAPGDAPLYYRFDEGIGSTAVNVGDGGITLNGTIGAGSSAPSWSMDGKFGKALRFDGTDDVVTTTSSSPISPTGNFSFSSWVQMTDGFSSSSTTNQTIVDKGDYKLYFDEADGKAKFVINPNGTEAFDTLETVNNGLSSFVSTMVVWNDELYVGGSFTNAGGDADGDRIAKWDGSSWSWPTGMGLGGAVYSMTVWNNELYVGGNFTDAGGDPDADHIAKWDGSSWSWPTGMELNNNILDMVVWNDELYVGGTFTDAGGDGDADRVARWNGSSFSWPTGQGLNGIVDSIAVLNSDLYVGGIFTNAGGDGDANRIARWNGSSFSWPTGQGLNNWVTTMTVWNNELYVGGQFTDAGGDGDADRVARWNGSSFSWPTGQGLNNSVNVLTVWNDELYVGGLLTDAGGDPDADYIALWNGSAFSWPDGLGLNGTVSAIAAWNNELYVGGQFTNASGNPNADYIVKFSSSYIAPTATSNTTNSWTAGTWYHLAGVHDGTYLRLYVNGIEESKTVAPTVNTQGLNLLLGNSYAGEALKGSLDEVKFYDTALSPDQIKTEYNRAAATVFGATSTAADGVTSDNSAAREYCIPGDTSTCTPPVSEWKLDENRGTIAYDTSGNSLNGTVTGGARWSPGKVGQSLLFNSSSSQYVTVANNSLLNITGDITVSGWAYPDTNGNLQVMVFKGSTASNARQYGVRITSSNQWQVNYTIGSTEYYVGNVAATAAIANRWQHIAWTRSGSNSTLYIDGVAVATGTQAGAMNSTSNALAIGRLGATAGEYFNGKIDDVRIYNYARTPAQIAWEYNRGAPVAQYKLDECQGTTAYNTVRNGNNKPVGMNGTITIGGSGTNTSAGTCVGGSSQAWANGATGRNSASLSLDGTDDYIQISDTANLRFDASASDFSTFAWVKRAANGSNHYIISKEDADNDGWRLMIQSNNTVMCSVDAIDIVSTATITDTNWHHIGCVIDRDGNGQVYIDGHQQSNNVAILSEGMATTSNIRIGSRSYTATNYFNGQIDDVHIFNYALTPVQVRTLYNSGAVSLR